jgi:hypothetical protein
MADLSVTAGNVRKGDDAYPLKGTAGATITAGMPVYLDAVTGKLKPCIKTGLAESSAIGIALHGASDGQPLQYVAEDAEFTVGATLTVGTIYTVGAAAGGIAPTGDLAATNYVTVLGVAVSASKLKLKPIVSGVVVPG